MATISGSHVKRITQVNRALPVEFLAQSKVIRWRSADGLEIEGLLTLPFNYQSEKKYPLLLMIHGGPPGVFQQNFIGGVNPISPYFIATSASHDYAILRCNVRGSTGYGENFRTAICYDLGGKDFDDLMAGVDHIIDIGIADPERLGIMGWSFGGYLTAWSLSQTDRFKAASVGAGISDFVSFAGTTDCTEFMPLYCGGEFWDKLSIYHTRSPICHVNKFSTPTLIQHGEKDVRVPIGQAHQLYHALKQRNVRLSAPLFPMPAM
ncbi:MAG: Dipeptidyl-peptidase 5 [Chlamydiae bacterium]|nr:Dipeptidyl-peptidase 5 [Chlamydiota bacterium]